MSLFRGLWITFVAAVLPAGTLIVALVATTEGPISSGGGIAIVLTVLIAMATALPVAAWGVAWTLVFKQTKLPDVAARVLLVLSFAALFLLVEALPRGPDGGGTFNPEIVQGLLIGSTALGEILRTSPWLGFGWTVVIAAVAFTPVWLGVPLTAIAPSALTLVLAEAPHTEAPRREKRASASEYRLDELAGDKRPASRVAMVRSAGSYTAMVDGSAVVVTGAQPTPRPSDDAAPTWTGRSEKRRHRPKPPYACTASRNAVEGVRLAGTSPIGGGSEMACSR